MACFPILSDVLRRLIRCLPRAQRFAHWKILEARVYAKLEFDYRTNSGGSDRRGRLMHGGRPVFERISHKTSPVTFGPKQQKDGERQDSHHLKTGDCPLVAHAIAQSVLN